MTSYIVSYDYWDNGGRWYVPNASSAADALTKLSEWLTVTINNGRATDDLLWVNYRAEISPTSGFILHCEAPNLIRTLELYCDVEEFNLNEIMEL